MPISPIAAENTERLRFDPEESTFKPLSEVEAGPIFTIRSLHYFDAQRVLQAKDDEATEDVEMIRTVLAAGLVEIDGDPKQAEAFLNDPAAQMVNPLFNSIWQRTWGN